MNSVSKGLCRPFLLNPAFLLVLLTSSCDADLAKSELTKTAKPKLQSVEVGPPNAKHQQPAFEGQTRAAELTTEYPLKPVTVTHALARPWSLALLPDQRFLITEKPGNLRIVNQQGEVGKAIANVPKVDSSRQGGLLDVVLSPNFEQDRLIYFSYAQPRKDGSGTAVAKARLSDDETQLLDVEIIFRQTPSWRSSLHFGSRLVWDNSGNLFITLGERSVAKARVLAQDLTTHLGKVVRIDPNGKAPADNPFISNKKAKPEIWSYGHRNPQGAALHPVTGELWTIEHGPRGGDEVNKPQPGKNYGWPVISYGIEYSGRAIGAGITAAKGMEQPLYYWDPVIAPSDMIFYTGDMFKEWQGDLLVGALKEQCIVRLKLKGGQVIGEQRLLENQGRVRDIAQADDGSIWWITDDGQLRVLRL